MIFESHKLFENINKMKGTNDMSISRELILSEMSKIIMSRPTEVRRVLINCGVAINERPSKVELVKKVNYNIARSRCLRNSLGQMIADNQIPFGNEEYMNQSGTQTQSSSKSSFGSDWGGTIGNIIGTGFGIWQTGQSRKEGQSQRAHEMELARLNTETMLKQMELQQQLSGMQNVQQAGVGGGGNMVTILLVLGVVAVIGFAIYASRKKAPATVTTAPATN